jgi:hypothetical protein
MIIFGRFEMGVYTILHFLAGKYPVYNRSKFIVTPNRYSQVGARPYPKTDTQTIRSKYGDLVARL